MDALGFVLIVVGASLVIYQFMFLLAALAMMTAMAGKFNQSSVAYYHGVVGIVVAAAGALVMYFGN